jgi:hypothetical protein
MNKGKSTRAAPQKKPDADPPVLAGSVVPAIDHARTKSLVSLVLQIQALPASDGEVLAMHLAKEHKMHVEWIVKHSGYGRMRRSYVQLSEKANEMVEILESLGISLRRLGRKRDAERTAKIVAMHQEGKDVAQIAKELHMTESGVRKQITRAKGTK